MYKVTESYKKAIKENIRDVKIVGTATLKDGSSVDLSDSNIVEGSLYVNSRCVSGDDIDFGTVYAAEMGLALYYDENDNPYKYDGAYFDLKFGIKIDDTNYEYVPLGIYRVSEIKRSLYSVNFVCVDDIVKLDKVATSIPDVSKTMLEWIYWACNKCGVTCGTTSVEGFPNAALTGKFKLDENDTTEYTYRDIIQYALVVIGAFGYIDRYGKFQIKKFHSAEIDYKSYPNDRFTSDLSDSDVQITKFSYKSGDKTYFNGVDGYEISLEKNPFIESMTKSTVLIGLRTHFKDFRYSICNFTENGDPALDVGDTIRYYANPKIDEYMCMNTHAMLAEKTHEELANMKYGSDNESDMYNTSVVAIAMNITWKYRQQMTVNSYGKENFIRREYSPIKKIAQSIVKITNDIINLNLQDEYLNNCIGGYVWIRLNDENHNEILIMDNPDPTKAVKVWRWNLNGLGYSNNCTGVDNSQRTYKIAITMDGTISGDFIKTGIIQSSDGTLQINLNSGAAKIIGKIVADSGSIGNWNISDNEIYSQNGDTYTTIKRNGDVAFAAGANSYSNTTGAALQIYHSGQIRSNSSKSRTIVDTAEISFHKKNSDDTYEETMRFNDSGTHFSREGKNLGFVGTNKVVSTDKRGLVFDLEFDGDYMSWGYKKNASDDTYTQTFTFYRDEGFSFQGNTVSNAKLKGISFLETEEFAEGIGVSNAFTIYNDTACNIWADIDFHNYDIINADISTTSDRRLKDNIHQTDVNALDIINKMEAVQYDWKSDGIHEELGFIAQQIKEVNDKFVSNINDDTLAIKYTKIIPYLIKAVQELSEKIERKCGNDEYT